ncbi:MAG: hypothetical protein GC181_02715 [Bacteroidetes bacterium]|nr:hypothetical protein [Bacteroidota bacterium]
MRWGFILGLPTALFSLYLAGRFMVPVTRDLIMEVPEGDEFFLLVSFIISVLTSVASGFLMLKAEKVNSIKFLRILMILVILVAGFLLTFLFITGIFILSVAIIAGTYYMVTSLLRKGNYTYTSIWVCSLINIAFMLQLILFEHI